MLAATFTSSRGVLPVACARMAPQAIPSSRINGTRLAKTSQRQVMLHSLRCAFSQVEHNRGSAPRTRTGSYSRRTNITRAQKEDGPVYVTTPIYYVNDKPHIGHVYTSTLADVYARCQRLRGKDVFYLTGTDEHGIKVEQSAAKRGMPPQDLANENSQFFREAMTSYGMSFDDFIRTTDDRHKQQVSAFISRMKDSGDVYLGEFVGWYDEGQEEYYTETKAKESDYKSPISGKEMVRAKEENYYFRLSAFQDRLVQLYEDHPEFVQPEARRNEVLNRIKGGLQDVPVSRTNFSWGIPFPGDDKHVVYVWIDALFNYLSALGMGTNDEEARGVEDRRKFWPASVHVMAKEIVWFHGVIWPAVLMSLNLPLPGQIYAHGFWVRDGVKMSKSLGNFVDLEKLNSYVEQYSLDGMRYYLLTEGPMGSQDANFSEERLNDIYSCDLVNTLGNCASRTTAMINKYYKDAGVPSEIGASGERVVTEGFDFPALTKEATEKAVQSIEEFDLPGVAKAGIGLVQKVDIFISETEPFRLAKDESKAEELASILYQCIETVRIAGVILEGVMPTKMNQLAKALGTSELEGTLEERAEWGKIVPGMIVEKVALFPRVDTPAKVDP